MNSELKQFMRERSGDARARLLARTDQREARVLDYIRGLSADQWCVWTDSVTSKMIELQEREGHDPAVEAVVCLAMVGLGHAFELITEEANRDG